MHAVRLPSSILNQTRDPLGNQVRFQKRNHAPMNPAHQTTDNSQLKIDRLGGLLRDKVPYPRNSGGHRTVWDERPEHPGSYEVDTKP